MPHSVPTKPDKCYHHGNLREALVVAGLDLLESAGLEALSLRGIAALAGVSHTAPKNHFDSKRALATALATEGFWKLAIALHEAVDSAGPRRESLRQAARSYVGFALDHPALFELMFSTTHCDRKDANLAEAEGAALQTLTELAGGLDWKRNHAPFGHQRTEWMLWSYMHGYAMLALSGRFLCDASGKPVHDVVKIMPDFNYG